MRLGAANSIFCVALLFASESAVAQGIPHGGWELLRVLRPFVTLGAVIVGLLVMVVVLLTGMSLRQAGSAAAGSAEEPSAEEQSGA